VASGALLIDGSRLARDQIVPAVLMHRVALNATHLVLGVTAINTADMGSLILMARKTNTVGLRRGQFCRLENLGGIRGLRMLAARPVAGFASLFCPAALLVFLDRLVRTLLESVEDIFVTSLAGRGTDRFSGLVIGLGRFRRLRRFGLWGG
jgi:hypothetical protein